MIAKRTNYKGLNSLEDIPKTSASSVTLFDLDPEVIVHSPLTPITTSKLAWNAEIYPRKHPNPPEGGVSHNMPISSKHDPITETAR